MKTHLKNIIQEAEAALAKLEDPVPAPDTKLTLSLAREAQGDRQAEVRVEWEPALSKKEGFDIWYYDPQRHKEWQLNIKMHVPDADLSKGQWDFPIWAGTWRFQARWDGGASDVAEYTYTQGKEEPEPEEPEEPTAPEPKDPEPPVQRRVIPIGFWDHYINDSRTLPNSLLPYVNIGKSMSRTVNPITKAGLPAIMHLGNLSSETQDERKKRVRSIPQYVQNRDVDIIHFIDEPLSKGIPGPVLDELVDYAREVHGDKFKYAYTINGGELYYPNNRTVNTYAQRFDYVFHQSYPYRHYGGESYLRRIGDTKAELFASLDLRLKTLKEKIPNSKFWFVPQGFYSVNAKKEDRKYKIPPVDSPIWYTEWAMANEEVQGLIWWKYFTTRDKVWHAMDRMPEHMESFKKAYEMMNS